MKIPRVSTAQKCCRSWRMASPKSHSFQQLFEKLLIVSVFQKFSKIYIRKLTKNGLCKLWDLFRSIPNDLEPSQSKISLNCPPSACFVCSVFQWGSAKDADVERSLRYCGWKKSCTTLGWLNAYKKWEYTTYQLVQDFFHPLVLLPAEQLSSSP